MNRGHTLVEVLVAVAIIALALVPLLQLLPGMLAPMQTSDVDLRLGAAGIRKIEELTHSLRADINGAASAAEVCTDLPDCRLEWTLATEISSATPGVGVLKTLSVLACQDRNGNNMCDAAEPRVRYDAKVTSRP